MGWDPEQFVDDLLAVAELAGIKLQRDATQIEKLHRKPG